MSYSFQHEEILGSTLSGSDGEVNRTYTLANSNSEDSMFILKVSGSILQNSLQYTKSDDTITFLVPVFDTDNIEIDYVVVVGVVSAAVDYATTIELARFNNVLGTVPDYTIQGDDRVKETIGTGDGSTSIFYFDYSGVLADSYTLYYGSSESTAAALTETSDYVVDKDLGKITLTGTGITKVSTDNIYASYSYAKTSHGYRLTDTQLQEALDMALNYFESETNNKFVDGTVATPDYKKVSDEKHDGQGRHFRDFYSDYFPIANVYTTLTSSAAVSDSTLSVSNTDGFPDTGTIGIETDKITYTGKTSTTFTGCSGVASAHASGTKVRSYVVEVSTTESGGTPTWQALTEDDQFDIEFDTGKVHLFSDNINLSAYTQSYPPREVPNRFRLNYLFGNSEIPNEVKQCVLMIASKNLLHMTGRRTGIDGLNTKDKTGLMIDNDYIKSIIDKNSNIQVLRC